jgi:hypothetical protein
MLRKLSSVLAALALAAGFAVAASGTASAQSFTPTTGHYMGAGHMTSAVMVQLTLTQHGTLSGVKVGSHNIGGGHVRDNMFDYCDHSGNCFRGKWYNSVYVGGSFKLAGHHTWSDFGLYPAYTPSPGDYSGSDYPGYHTSVGFKAVHEHGGLIIKNFRIDHHIIGNAHVGHYGHFDTCHGGTCFSGFWDASSHVLGRYKLHGTHHWVNFDANQYLH